MKWLFVFLVLFNLGAFGWNALSRPLNQEETWRLREFHPEKIRIVSEAEMARTASKGSKKTAGVAPRAELQQCLVWAGIPDADVSQAKQLLEGLKTGLKVKQLAGEERERYWVYLPPVKSTSAAEKTIASLRDKGLDSKDYFIVRDPGALRNAISLGVFSTQEAAQFRLSSLQDKGVSGAELGLRDKVRVNDFVVFDASDATQEALSRLSSQIRLSEVSKRDCPSN